MQIEFTSEVAIEHFPQNSHTCLQKILQAIITQLSDKYGKENIIATFTKPNDLSLDKKTGVAIIIGLYKALVKRMLE